MNLLGGGSWKWSGAGQIDSKTLAKIRWCEVGGEFRCRPRNVHEFASGIERKKDPLDTSCSTIG